MKRTALLCIAVALTVVPARASVLPGSAAARAPAIAVAPDGTEYVAATVGEQTLLWRNGARITPGGLFSALPDGSEGAIATDTAGYLHTARVGSQAISVARSIDAGDSWDRGSVLARVSHPGRVAIAAGKFNSGLEGATLWMAFDTDAGVVVARSLDGGLSFSPMALETGAAIGGIATDPSNADIAWVVVARAKTASVYALTPTSNILEMSSPAELTSAPSIARASDGSLMVTYASADAVISYGSHGGAWTRQTLGCAGAAASSLAAHNDFVLASICDGTLTTWRAHAQQPFSSAQEFGAAQYEVGVAVDAGEHAHIASIKDGNVAVVTS